MKKFFAALAALYLLVGCAPTRATAPEDHSGHITVANAYVRATDDMSKGMDGSLMTGAFMEITNHHDDPITLVGGDAAFASEVQVHEVVSGVMQQKRGGIEIAGGATVVLKPGGNHLMLMGLSSELKAGQEVTFTLKFSDGHTVDVTAPVKAVNLDQEHYSSASPSAS